MYNLYLSSFRFVETDLISSGNRSHLFTFFTTFYQQLMAATLSGTVNELSAFKNLLHLVCPYFTDHARIANKSKFTESMQIILYLVLFQLYLVITRFLDLVISVSDASCELTYTLVQQSHILSGCFMSG